jgi:hypothetical protein
LKKHTLNLLERKKRFFGDKGTLSDGPNLEMKTRVSDALMPDHSRNGYYELNQLAHHRIGGMVASMHHSSKSASFVQITSKSIE